MKTKNYAAIISCFFLLMAGFSIGVHTTFADEFSEDFELGLGDWHADNGVWEVGIPGAGPESRHSGTQCAGTVLGGDYPLDTDSRFISPTIQLPEVSGTDEIHLRFWHSLSYFTYSSNYYDHGLVQISVYSDGSWSDFTTMSDDINNTSNSWTQRDVDLSAYASERIRIAFYHVVYDYAGATSTGWYIDDVSITSPQGIWVVDFDEDGDGVPDSTDQCPETPANACVDNVGCSSEGSYTQAQVDEIVAHILNWGDIDEDGKIGLSEAINALQVVTGDD